MQQLTRSSSTSVRLLAVCNCSLHCTLQLSHLAAAVVVVDVVVVVVDDAGTSVHVLVGRIVVPHLAKAHAPSTAVTEFGNGFPHPEGGTATRHTHVGYAARPTAGHVRR